MMLKIQEIEKADAKIRKIFSTAQMVKESDFKIVWIGDNKRVAELIEGKPLKLLDKKLQKQYPS